MLNTPLHCSRVANRSVYGACRASSALRLGQILLLAAGTYCCFGLRLFAQTFDSRATEESNQSWTATSEQENGNLRPTRIIQSHRQNGNKTLDMRSVDILGYDGHFEHYQDIETETSQVDAATVRTTTRTFGPDVNGRKTLVQVVEEERRTLPEGTSNVVRVTCNPDVNGELQPVQREILETRKIGMNVEQTKTTMMLNSINGGLAPVLKSDEIRRRDANQTIESQKNTLLADGTGNWQVAEIRQNTVRQEGDNRSTEERVFRRDAEDKLSEVSRVVSKESDSSSSEKRDMVETYSLDVPGITRDGSLHLIERATTVQRTSATGEQVTEKQLEQPDPGNPDSGLRVSVLVNDTVRPVPSGEQTIQTISVRDSNGRFGVVSVDTTKSDRVATIQIEQTR